MRPDSSVTRIRPDVGDPAPDVSLLDIAGRQASLSMFWRSSPALVLFLRYFGCPFCQEQVAHLRDERHRFEAVDAQTVLVGQGTPEEGASFSERMHPPFPILIDPDRAAYRAYGLGRGSINQVAGPRVVGPFIRNNARRETRQRGLHGGSFMQMPGTFVIDAEGVVRLAHRSRHVADTPRNAVLLELLERIRPTA